MSKVLIALSVYNDATTLSRAIESILAQTFSDWRLVVVDDGSTDCSQKTIQKYVNLDRRIKSISNKSNCGLAFSLNKAIASGNEPLIARMDADDFALPNRLEMQKNFLDINPDVDVLGTAAKFRNQSGGSFRIITKPLVHDDIYSRIETINPFVHSSVMMRRSFFDAMQGYDITCTRAQDYDLWLRGVDKYIYANLSDVLMEYEMRPQSFLSLIYGFKVRLSNGLRRKRFIIALVKALYVFLYGLLHKFKMSIRLR